MVIVMKKRLFVLFLFAFILFPFVANAESFDCYYTATTGNKKTVVGYNIGGNVKVVEFKGKTLNLSVSSSNNSTSSKYGTDKCYPFIAVAVKEKKQHSGYNISYKIGNSEEEVKFGSSSNFAVTKITTKPSETKPDKNGTQDNLDITPVDMCSSESTSLKVFQVIGYILLIIKIIVPLILIVLGTIDFAKAALSGDDKSTKEAAVQFSKRVLIGLIVFFIPTILDFFLSLVSGASETASKYNNCTNCVFNPNNKNKCNPKGLTE